MDNPDENGGVNSNSQGSRHRELLIQPIALQQPLEYVFLFLLLGRVAVCMYCARDCRILQEGYIMGSTGSTFRPLKVSGSELPDGGTPPIVSLVMMI